MKKISFLLAMIMILSSLFAVPVFAADAPAALTEYTFDGTSTKDTTNALTATNTLASSTGLTFASNVAAPLKNSTDTAYKLSGTASANALTQAKSFYTSFSALEGWTSSAFYTVSVDFFVSSESEQKEFILKAGTSKWGLPIVLKAGTYAEDTDKNCIQYGRVFYGFETDKWNNLVVAVEVTDPNSAGKATINLKPYLNGVALTKYYKPGSTAGTTGYPLTATENDITTSSISSATAAVGGYVDGRVFVRAVKDKQNEFYFDNLKFTVSDTAYAGGTPVGNFGSNGDSVVVNETTKEITIKATVNKATIDSFANAGEKVEIYRADDSAAGYSLVESDFETGDIVSITSSTGAYKYYSLIVLPSEITFDGTADDSATKKTFGNLAYEKNVQAPLTIDAAAYSVSGTGSETAVDGFEAAFAFADEKHYSYTTDFYIASENSNHKEFVVTSGVDGYEKTFVFKDGNYVDADVCGIGDAIVFYGIDADKWHKLVVAIDVDADNIVTLTPYVDGVKQDKYHTVSEGTVGADVVTVALTSESAVEAGYNMTGNIGTDNVSGATYNFYFDNVQYKALSDAYTTSVAAEIANADDDKLILSQDSENQNPLVSTVKETFPVEGEVTYEIYSNETKAILSDSDRVANGGIVKLTSENGIYSYYTVNVLTRDQYISKKFNEVVDAAKFVDAKDDDGNVTEKGLFTLMAEEGFFADVDTVISEYETMATSNSTAFEAINTLLLETEFTTEAQIADLLKENVTIKSLKAMVNDTQFKNFVARVGEQIGLDMDKYNSIEDPYNSKNVDEAIILAKANINELGDEESGLIKLFSDECDKELARDIEDEDEDEDDKKTSGPSYSGGRIPGSVGVPIKPEVKEEEDTDYSKVPSPFGDLGNGHWSYEYIMQLVEEGILSGYEDGTFKPEKDVLREEIVKMLIEAFSENNPNAISDFSDLSKNDWFYSYVATAIEKGYVNGIGNNAFGAGRSVSRQDCVVMIYNIIQKLGVELPAERSYASFADESNIASYAKDAIRALYCAGIIDGTGTGFNPEGNLTRAEAAKIICGVLKIVKG